MCLLIQLKHAVGRLTGENNEQKYEGLEYVSLFWSLF